MCVRACKQVFQTGAQSKEDAKNPVVFHLPKALEADAIGIFPDEWVHKPYLSIDILACYLLPGRVRRITSILMSHPFRPPIVSPRA